MSGGDSLRLLVLPPLSPLMISNFRDIAGEQAQVELVEDCYWKQPVLSETDLVTVSQESPSAVPP